MVKTQVNLVASDVVKYTINRYYVQLITSLIKTGKLESVVSELHKLSSLYIYYELWIV